MCFPFLSSHSAHMNIGENKIRSVMNRKSNISPKKMTIGRRKEGGRGQSISILLGALTLKHVLFKGSSPL